MIDLKCCPFCGGTAKMRHELRKGLEGSVVECEICGAQAKWKMINCETASDEEAAKAWNRRYLAENEIDDGK